MAFLKKFYLLSFIILAGTGLFAQEELSLAKAIQTGLVNNYQIRIIKKDLEIAKNNDSWGLAGRYPNITIGINQYNMAGDDQNGQYFSNTVAPNINLNWMIFDGYAVSINKAKLAEVYNLSDGMVQLVVQNTLMGIILAYYKSLLEQEKLQVLGELLKLSSDRYKYESLRKEIGSAVTFDLLQAENSYLADSANYLLQEMNYNNALRDLNLLIGVDIEEAFELTDEFSVERKDFDYLTLETKMFSDNINLKNQYINQTLLTKDVELSKNNRLPSLSLNTGSNYLGARYNYENIDPTTLSNYDFYLNFSLNFNLYNGGNIKRAIQNAIITEEQGDIEIEEMQQTLKNDLAFALNFYDVRKQLYNVAEIGVESATLNLQIATEKFRAGTINSFNFRDVQLIYLNAALGRLETIYNLILSETELQRLTGGIISEYQN